MRILIASSNPHKVEEINATFNALRLAAREQASLQSATDKARAVPEFRLLSLTDIDRPIPEPVEDAQTFEGNAVKKARHYSASTGLICIADDSGIEVDALGGAPGVRSARYSGATGPRLQVDIANNRLLIESLREVAIEERTARFVCAMALVTPEPDLPIDFEDRSALAARKTKAADKDIKPQPRRRKSSDDTPANAPDILALVRGTIEGRILMPEECADPASPWCGRGDNGFGYDPLFFVPDFGCTTAELTPERKNEISHRGAALRHMWRALQRLMQRAHDSRGS